MWLFCIRIEFIIDIEKINYNIKLKMSKKLENS